MFKPIDAPLNSSSSPDFVPLWTSIWEQGGDIPSDPEQLLYGSDSDAANGRIHQLINLRRSLNAAFSAALRAIADRLMSECGSAAPLVLMHEVYSYDEFAEVYVTVEREPSCSRMLLQWIITYLTACDDTRGYNINQDIQEAKDRWSRVVHCQLVLEGLVSGDPGESLAFLRYIYDADTMEHCCGKDRLASDWQKSLAACRSNVAHQVPLNISKF